MITLFTLTYQALAMEQPDREVDLRKMATAAASGNAAAQRQIYQDRYAYAMSIALHYASRREEAEEITQDAFVKFFRRLLKEVPEGSINAYFGKIVVNTAIDLLRKRKKRFFTEEITERSINALGNSRNTGNDSIQREEIYRLLQALPPSYRMVFNLHVLEGYNHPEIAKRLKISVGASKSSLSKARAKLKKLAAIYYEIK